MCVCVCVCVLLLFRNGLCEQVFECRAHAGEEEWLDARYVCSCVCESVHTLIFRGMVSRASAQTQTCAMIYMSYVCDGYIYIYIYICHMSVMDMSYASLATKLIGVSSPPTTCAYWLATYKTHMESNKWL